MLAVPLVADMDPATKGQQTHLLAAALRIVPPVDVAESGRDVVRRVIQPSEPLLGVAQPPGFGMLAGFGPQTLVGSSHLPEDTAGHLGRQPKLRADLSIQGPLQPSAAAGLAVGKGILAHQIESVAVSELRGS